MYNMNANVIGVATSFHTSFLSMKDIILDSIFSDDTILLITEECGNHIKFNDGSKIVWIDLKKNDLSNICGYRFSTIYALDKNIDNKWLTELAARCNIHGGRLFHYDQI